MNCQTFSTGLSSWVELRAFLLEGVWRRTVLALQLRFGSAFQV